MRTNLKARNEQIVASYSDGLDPKEIARAHGLTVQRINQIVKESAKPIRSIEDLIDDNYVEPKLYSVNMAQSCPECGGVIRFCPYCGKPLKTINSTDCEYEEEPKDERYNNHITFTTFNAAEEVLSKVLEKIVCSGQASLADFYKLSGLKYIKDRDHERGWDNAKNFSNYSQVKKVRGGYIIKLARCRQIDRVFEEV